VQTERGEALAKSWLFRFRLNGRSRYMGLGPLRTVSLAQARERAKAARNLIYEGKDPIDERRAKRAEALAESAKRVTFQEAAERYIAAHGSSWKNPKHLSQWKATLQTYAYPLIGKLPVDAIELPHVLKVLEPIWGTKTETASRLRGRIERILAWSTVRKYRSGENPARWVGNLKETLPAKTKVAKTRHHPALPYGEIPAFMEELRANGSISARALEFTILTAARTSEVIGAKWPEIDRQRAVWVVPAERMKSGKEHEIPLSRRLLDILDQLPREEGDFVFPGATARAPLSNMAMLELLRGIRGKGTTVHGFRSTFRDWAGDRTAYPREVIEHALAHRIKDKAEASYRRTAALEKRRRLMEEWARYCLSPSGRAAEVVPLHA
jgi:integrase